MLLRTARCNQSGAAGANQRQDLAFAVRQYVELLGIGSDSLRAWTSRTR